MASKGTWILAVGLDLLARNLDEEVTVAKLVSVSGGSREALRGAYARALALAAELPDDRQARRLVQVISRAMRRQWDPRQDLAAIATAAS